MRTRFFLPALALFICVPACGGDDTPANDDDSDTDTPTSTSDEGPTTTDPSEGDSTGTSDTSQDTDDPPPDIEGARMLFEPIIRATCEQAFSCCNSDELFVRLGSTVNDVDTCTERMLDLMEAGVSPPHLGLNDIYLQNYLPLFAYGLSDAVTANEAGIEACAASIAAQGCPESVDGSSHCVPPATTPSDACELTNLFTGSREMGESCGLYQNIECVEGLRCSIYGPSTGVCIAALSAGDPCFEDYHCQGDLLCDYMTDTCTPPALAGEDCAYVNADNPQIGTETVRCRQGLNCNPASGVCESEECTFGTYCDNDDARCPDGLSCVTGRCDLLATAGEQCWDDDDCALGQCIYNGQDQVCQAPSPNGTACFDPVQCESGFCSVSGSCAAALDVGDDCDPGENQGQCDGGYCDGAMCVAFAGVGDDCSAQPCDSNQGLRCIDATCVAPPFPDGEYCNDHDQCDSGFCNDVCATPLDLGDACSVGSSQCGTDNYCGVADGGGECRVRLGEGAPCESNAECWSQCEPVNGELRCRGTAPGQRVCDGA